MSERSSSVRSMTANRSPTEISSTVDSPCPRTWMVASELWYGTITQEGTFPRTVVVTWLHTTRSGPKSAVSRSRASGSAIRTSRFGRYLRRASSSVSQYMVGAIAMSTRTIRYPFLPRIVVIRSSGALYLPSLFAFSTASYSATRQKASCGSATPGALKSHIDPRK